LRAAHCADCLARLAQPTADAAIPAATTDSTTRHAVEEETSGGDFSTRGAVVNLEEQVGVIDPIAATKVTKHGIGEVGIGGQVDLVSPVVVIVRLAAIAGGRVTLRWSVGPAGNDWGCPVTTM
jgi:hypothetical protein